MSSPVATVASATGLHEAVAVMCLREIGNLVVAENGRPSGILTEREILRYLALGKELPDIPVSRVPLRKFVRVAPDVRIIDAAKTMVEKRTRLLVFNDGNLVGIITASDILRAFAEASRNPSLEGIVRKKVFTLRPHNTILAAVKVMYRKGVGSVVVE